MKSFNKGWIEILGVFFFGVFNLVVGVSNMGGSSRGFGWIFFGIGVLVEFCFDEEDGD